MSAATGTPGGAGPGTETGIETGTETGTGKGTSTGTASAPVGTAANNDLSRSILITGCSSGIGLDAAVTLHNQGWFVLATCRSETDCVRLREEGLTSFTLDYADEASVHAGAQQALALTDGKLFALFNNGAYAIPGAAEDLPRDALRAIFETNVFGQFQLINLLMPTLKRNNRGRIINCSSVLGMTAMRYRGAYNATKFAMEGLTDTLRLENMDSPVRFSLIEPGPINTRIRENSIAHFERWINEGESDFAERYTNELKPRLYQTDTRAAKDRFELQPAAVTKRLIEALESTHPKPRYFVTKPTYIAALLKRVLTTRAVDRIVNRW